MGATNAINLDKQNDEELPDDLKYVSSHLKQSMKDANSLKRLHEELFILENLACLSSLVT